MKSSFSNMWLLGLVALFIFIFAGYLAVTISYSTAFKMKNEMILIIEKHNGMTYDQGSSESSKITGGSVVNPGALQTINLYLYGMGYRTKGPCPYEDGGWIGVNSMVDNKQPVINVEPAQRRKKYYYCFAKYASTYGKDKKTLGAVYYKVRLFYKMDLPVLGDLFTFNVEGTTTDIYNPSSNSY